MIDQQRMVQEELGEANANSAVPSVSSLDHHGGVNYNRRTGQQSATRHICMISHKYLILVVRLLECSMQRWPIFKL